MLEDGAVISAIIEKRNALSLQHALLIGISGIDAAGKGFVTARIAESLQERGLEVLGQRDSTRRKVAITGIYTADCAFFESYNIRTRPLYIFAAKPILC